MDNGLQWDKVVFMKWHILDFLMTQIILFFSWQKYETAWDFRASGKQLSKDSVAAWCLVA